MSRLLVKRRTFLSLLAANCVADHLPLYGAMSREGHRQKRKFDDSWKFLLGNIEGSQAVDFDDRSWRILDLPHDWSIEGDYAKSNPGGALTGYLPTGIGWYRKSFDIPAKWDRKQISILFDAIFMNSTVWINGVELGTRPYGYISFAYDLTPYLHRGLNVISIRVDNSKQPAARWYTGSGIYAHVQLQATNSVHIAEWGVFVRTTELRSGQALLRATIEIANQTQEKVTSRLQVEVLDPGGVVVARAEPRCDVLAKGTGRFDQDFTVLRPSLWSPDTPSIYRLRITVMADHKVVDEYEAPFGIRTTGFDPDRGFLLNGVSLKLRGVADHYCAPVVGVAIPDALLDRQLALLKEMGVNTIRTAHHPRPPIFYEICNRLGLMVMNELFDGWHRKAEQDYGARFFDAWWKRDASDCVRRDRNHPSVILWSIGNETGSTDTLGISKLIHSLDGTRCVTGGQVLNGVDVSGFNGPGGTPGTLEKFHATHTKQPIILTEEPHTLQTRGFYRVMTWWRDKDRPRYEFPPYGTKQIFFDGNAWYNSSYDNAGVRMTVRTSWKRTESWSWLAGEFRWTGCDYLGEAGFSEDSWPARMWNYGVIDLAGLPKDDFYLYKSFWTRKPMVHLLPHWTHPGMEGVIIPVVAYSNAEEVELFFDKISLGRQKPRELGDFVWNVPYRPGELRAVAYSAEKMVAETSFKTAASPFRIALQTDNSQLLPTRVDIAVLTCSAVDENSVMVPWSTNRIEFKAVGPVRMLGFENGDPLDTTPNGRPYRKLFYGLCRGFFQATAERGSIEVACFGVLGNQLFPISTTVAIVSQHVALRGQNRKVKLEIVYTKDGSEPNTKSIRYEAPFQIQQSTIVRALLLCDGEPFMHTEAEFVKGETVPVTDPRWQKQEAVGPYSGPFDLHAAGNWSNGMTIYKLKPDGTVMMDSGPNRSIVGWWWYSVSADLFESPKDYGHGQIRFATSGQEVNIHLTSGSGDVLRIKDSKGVREWNRSK